MWWIDSIEVSVEGDQLVPGLVLVKVLGMSGTLEHQPDGGTGELDIGCVCVCVWDRQTDRLRGQGRDSNKIFQLSSCNDKIATCWDGVVNLNLILDILSLWPCQLWDDFFLFIYYLFIYLFIFEMTFQHLKKSGVGLENRNHYGYIKENKYLQEVLQY